MITTKACPFCGNYNLGYTSHQGDKWGALECGHCGAIGPEVRTGYDLKPDAKWHDEATTAWNTRVEDA